MKVANKAVQFRAPSLAEEFVSCAESPGIPLKGFEEGVNEIYMLILITLMGKYRMDWRGQHENLKFLNS